MGNTFTHKLESTAVCKHCKAEITRKELLCPNCGAKQTHPEFLAALIAVGLGILALYTLYQF